MKHHYSPKFYLKQWAGTDGRLCEYKHVAGRVVCRRTFPDGTGYERDLYRIHGLPEPLAHEVESKFMHMVDTQAKRALDKIMGDDRSPWHTQMRNAWTRFILSLLFRNPEAVNLIKPHMQDCWNAAMDSLQANYAIRRLPTDPPTFEEYIARTEPEAAQRAAMSVLLDTIDDAGLHNTISNMHWSKIVLEASRLSLLTSDRPLDKPFGFSSKDAYVALPIGPKTLFVAAYSDALAKKLAGTDPTEVVRLMNTAVVSRARRFVWGTEDSQLRFVQNRIGSAPEKPIISDEQRRAAVEASETGPN
jgi:hypothetical protein